MISERKLCCSLLPQKQIDKGRKWQPCQESWAKQEKVRTNPFIFTEALAKSKKYYRLNCTLTASLQKLLQFASCSSKPLYATYNGPLGLFIYLVVFLWSSKTGSKTAKGLSNI
jgi:hypothetical protein